MIIGIDQSYTSTGVAIVTEGGRLVESMAVTQRHKMTTRGLYQVATKVKEIVAGCQPEAEMIYIEGNSVSGSHSTTARRLAELAGALKYALYPLEVREVAMSTWKSRIAKNKLRGVKKATKSGKAEYLRIVHELTGYEFATTDEADAYMIALCGRFFYD